MSSIQMSANNSDARVTVLEAYRYPTLVCQVSQTQLDLGRSNILNVRPQILLNVNEYGDTANTLFPHFHILLAILIQAINDLLVPVFQV